MEPVIIIVNPAAGRGKAGTALERIQKWVRRQAPGVEILISEYPGHTTELVRQAPPDARIVAVGGDGTVHEVIGGLGPRQKLGIVPIGSGNDIARMAGLLRRELAAALMVAVWGGVKRYDLGLANGEPFASGATAGLDASVARRAFSAPRFLRGLPRYLWALIIELRHLSLPRVEIEVDGRPVYEGPMLITAVMNSPTYGGGFKIAPMARPNDGHFDLIRAGSFSRLGVLGILPRLIVGRHLSHPQIDHISGLTFTIKFDHQVPMQADGELMEPGKSLVVHLRPGELPIATDPRAVEAEDLLASERELLVERAATPAGVISYYSNQFGN